MLKRSGYFNLVDMSEFAAQDLGELADTILREQSGGLALEMFEETPEYIAWNFAGELTEEQVIGLVKLADEGKLPLDMMLEIFDVSQNYWLNEKIADAFFACANDRIKNELVAYAVCDCESLLPVFVDFVAGLKDVSTMHYALLQNAVADFGEASYEVESLLKKMYISLLPEDYAAMTAWLDSGAQP